MTYSCKSKAFTRPTVERVTFLTPGMLPSAATRPAALFAPLLRRSACAKKGNQRNTPRWRGLQASCLPTSRGCFGVRWMYVRVHSANGRASCAASCGLFLRALAASQGPRFGGILPQKQEQPLSYPIPRGSAGMHGFMDPGAVRGAEHRRRRRKLPAGARAL